MVFNTPTSTFSWYNPSIVSQLIKKKLRVKLPLFAVSSQSLGFVSTLLLMDIVRTLQKAPYPSVKNTSKLFCSSILKILITFGFSWGTFPKIGMGADHRNQNRIWFRLWRVGSFLSGPIWAPDSDKNISDVTCLGVIRCRKPNDRSNSLIYHAITLIGRDTILLW